MKRNGGSARPHTSLAALVVACLFAATASFAVPQTAAAQNFEGELHITKSVTGPVPPTTFSFVISPEVDGCTAEQTVTMDQSGGHLVLPVLVNTDGIQNVVINSELLGPSPLFNEVSRFHFSLKLADPQLLVPGGVYVNPALTSVRYSVDGTLPNPTPSGFEAFALERTIEGTEFYAQGSSLTIRLSVGADLSDGLHTTDLDNFAGPGLVLNARELDTGRYHPPLVQINSDGTGQIQNSNNTGGVNPGNGQVVDVDLGEEYITTLNGPGHLLADQIADCTYSVAELSSAFATPVTSTFTNVGFLQTAFATAVQFANVSTTPLFCNGRAVTIDASVGTANGLPESVLIIDRFPGDPAQVVIVGTPGDDVILGSNAGDIIEGRGGDDHICGGGGDDWIYGGDGDDWIITTGGGRNRLHGGLGIDRIFGSSGDDYIEGGGGSDAIHARAGNDEIYAGSGADRVFAGEGDDMIFGQGGQDFLYGESGNDTIQGTWQSDHIWGGEGDDTLRGAAGKDKIFGGPGDDSMFGGVNSDWLDGEAGTDEADGQAGREYPFDQGVIGCVAETVNNC